MRILESLSTGSQSIRSREGKVEGKVRRAEEEMMIFFFDCQQMAHSATLSSPLIKTEKEGECGGRSKDSPKGYTRVYSTRPLSSPRAQPQSPPYSKPTVRLKSSLLGRAATQREASTGRNPSPPQRRGHRWLLRARGRDLSSLRRRKRWRQRGGRACARRRGRSV